MSNVAVMFYGRGGELGNFLAFSHWLEKQLKPDYDGRFFTHPIHSRNEFFDLLADQKIARKIGELHVFAHSNGAGLYFEYHEEMRAYQRTADSWRAERRGWPLQYGEVLAAEDSTVFTDDFTREPYASMRAAIRDNLAEEALIKLWGCNAGTDHGSYTDDDLLPGDPHWMRHYYWSALNQVNPHKPILAQAVADYFDRPTFAATSGSHIEIRAKGGKGRWMKPKVYRAATGHGPKRGDDLRLEPDEGKFEEFFPKR